MKLSCSKIEKALDCCRQPAGSGSCNSCPFDYQRKKRLEENDKSCTELLFGCVSDLINRLKAENKNSGVKIQNQREQLKACNEKIKEQQAEIERLKEYPKCVYEYDGDIVDYCLKSPCVNYKTAKEIKSEAYKEFAERLKALLPYDGMSPEGRFKFGRIKSLDIDNILKEVGCE